MRLWPLLLLMAACSPRGRDRIFVSSADPVAAAAGRMTIKIDGACELEACAESIAIDVPRGILIGAFAKALDIARQGGVKELAILVDTPAGPGVVPLPFPRERGFVRGIWAEGEPDVPGYLVRPGFDGEIRTLTPGSLGRFGVFVEALAGNAFVGPGRDAAPPARPEDARFVLLEAGFDDTLKDVVLTLVSLEERFPGKVIFRLMAPH